MNGSTDRAVFGQVGRENFEVEVLRSPQPVLVVFWAPWSRPCQVIEPVLATVAAACVGRVKIVQVNADDHPLLSLWYEIQSIPSLLLFVAGSVRARIVGTASKEAILGTLQSVCSGDDSAPTALADNAR